MSVAVASISSLVVQPSAIDAEDSDVNVLIHELLASEVFIDLQRLRDLCRNSIPAIVRPSIWKSFLRVNILDMTEEVTHARRQTEMYEALFPKKASGAGDARIRGAIQHLKAFYPRVHGDPVARLKVEHVLSAFLPAFGARPAFFQTALIHLVRPFTIFDREEDMYYCFRAFMGLINPFLTPNGLKNELGICLMLFSYILPDLHDHLEEEKVEPNQWLMEWIALLLSKQLPVEDVLQLWDKYLVSEDGLGLHIYVCLALLQLYREQLLDMDNAELLRFLKQLPQTNVTLAIRGAYNIREDVRSRELL